MGIELSKPKLKGLNMGEHYDLARWYLLMEKERIHYNNSIDKFLKKGLPVPLCASAAYATFDTQEKTLREEIKKLCADPHYAGTIQYLCQYKGISDWTAILPMLMVNINVASRFSKLIKYSGLAPIPLKYACPDCKLEYEAEKAILKSGHVVCPGCQGLNSMVSEGKADFYDEKGKASYNPRLKMLVLGRVGKQLVMARGAFKERYDEYKAASLARDPDKRPSFHHAKANRKMVRDYLFVLWKTWRDCLGLEVPAPYAKALPIRWVAPDKPGHDTIRAD